MLIHDRFVFLHLQKTAGTFIAKALQRELPKRSLRSGAPGKLHPGWDDIPSDAMDRPVLLYVRNPWDWYVSWYHFVMATRPDNLVFRLLFAEGGNDFPTTVRNACEGIPIDGDPALEELISRGGNRQMELQLQGYDFYTARFLEFVGEGLDSDRLTIGRYESLFDDLECFLGRVGVSLTDAAKTRLRTGAPLNNTPHKPYRHYYDAELRDVVGSCCRRLIDRFGYSF